MAKSNVLQEKILPLAGKMQNNMYISSITQGMMGTMPVLMGGAILQLIYSLPITPWTNLLKSCGLYELLSTAVNICNLFAFFMVFAIGKTLGEKKGVDPFHTGLISLLSFLLITPLTTTEAGATVINTSYFGAQGVITAMLVALVAPSIFAFIVKKHLIIKLPEAVPEFVSNSFANIPPALITIVPFIALRGIFAMTSFGSFTDFIYAMIQTPLTSVGNTFAGHLILLFVCCLLWWFGIHGTLVVYPIMMTIMTAPLLANIEAANQGQAAPYLLSMMTFFMVLQFIGGPGCMFGLYVDMAFFSKSERYKAQGKVSLIPGLFNIIEPTVYGMPVVLNPILLIPFLGLPLIVYTLMYLCLNIGLFTTPVVNFGVMVMPGPIVGFLLGGGIGLGIFLILMCVLSVIVYLPFFRVLDSQALKEEKKITAA